MLNKKTYLKFLLIGLALVFFGAADSAVASMVWTGDYETGNLSQWVYRVPCLYNDASNPNHDTYPIASYPRYQILSGSGVRQGKYYVKYTAYPGDGCGSVSTTDRIGVEHIGFATPASYSDLYYGFSYKIDSSFKLLDGEWHSVQSSNTVWENHNQGTIGGANFQIAYEANKINFYHSDGAGKKVQYALSALNPAPVGVWIDFIYHIKYKKDATGVIEIWYRKEGQSEFTKILTLNNTRTDFMPSGADNNVCGAYPCDKLYVQETFYRGLTGGEVNAIQSIYYDNNHVATTFKEILDTFSGAVSPFPAHCYNSVQDGDEEGLNCGGSCSACDTSAADETVPEIKITCPPDNQTYNSKTISVAGTASDNAGIDKIEVKIGADGEYFPATGKTTWSISGLELKEGSNKVYARATDLSGNTTIASITLTYEILASTSTSTSTSTTGDPASLIFDGSFKAGDKWLGYGKAFGSWSFSTLIKEDTLTVSKSDRNSSNYTGKFLNRSGEFAGGETSVNRALLGSNQAANWPNNTELWSGFSMKLDPQWKFPAQGWELFWEVQQLFTLSNGSNHAYGPNLAISFPNGKNPLKFMHTAVLNGSTTQYDIAALTPGSWYDIMVHTKLTSSTSGFFYVYLRKPGETDYTAVISKTGVSTLFSQDTSTQGAYRAYSGAGYYRGASSESKSVYFENIKYGKTRASVEYGGSSAAGNYPPNCSVDPCGNGSLDADEKCDTKLPGSCSAGATCSADCKACESPICESKCPGGCANVGQDDPGGCTKPCPDNSGSSCSTGKLCDLTGTGKCSAGVCKNAAPVSCPADSACAGYSCDTSSGKCITNFKNGASCNSNNLCDLSGSGKCSDGICRGTPKSCADTNDCTFDSCDPATGGCLNVDACGGLVPCGRLVDNPETKGITESAPCDLCAVFYMIKKIINFAVQLVFALVVLALAIAGIIYSTSIGDRRRMDLARKAIYYSVVGLFIVIFVWFAIAIVLQLMGYASIGTWNQVNCVLK